MVPHANWHHPTSEHTKYSTYQQQCNGSKCSLWGMKMTTQPKLAEFSFYPLYSLLVSLNADVLVVVVVVDCVQAHDHRSPLSPLTHTASLWHRMPVRAVFALRFQNLPARNSSLKKFKHEKEEKLAGLKGKLAGPAQFLVAEGRGPALSAKTVRGMKQFSSTCAIIQIKYVLPKLCHLPQYSYGSRDPTTRVLG